MLSFNSHFLEISASMSLKEGKKSIVFAFHLSSSFDIRADFVKGHFESTKKITQVSQKHTCAMCSMLEHKSQPKNMEGVFFIFSLHLTNKTWNLSFKIRLNTRVERSKCFLFVFFLQETLNPTHFQETVEYFFLFIFFFYLFLIPAGSFPVWFSGGQQQEKIMKINLCCVFFFR